MTKESMQGNFPEWKDTNFQMEGVLWVSTQHKNGTDPGQGQRKGGQSPQREIHKRVGTLVAPDLLKSEKQPPISEGK